MNIAAKVDFEAAQICSYRDTRYRIEQAGRDFVRREHARALEENQAKELAETMGKERAALKALLDTARRNLQAVQSWGNTHRVIRIKPNSRILARTIMNDVCTKYNITPMDMISHRRDVMTIIPRHEAQYKIKRYTLMSLPELGRIFGGRDHTTILHAVKLHAARMAAGDPRIIPDTIEYTSQWEAYAGLADDENEGAE